MQLSWSTDDTSVYIVSDIGLRSMSDPTPNPFCPVYITTYDSEVNLHYPNTSKDLIMLL